MRVQRAEVVRDDVAEIAAAVRRGLDESGCVLTTGGIGPTHDHVTVAGAATAFGVGITTHPELARRIREHVGREPTAAELRMASVPEGAELVGGADTWPTIRVDRVYVLPGVPSILRRKFGELRGEFHGIPRHRESLAFRARETDLAPLLEQLVARFPDLEIGSYPEPARVLVTIEGTDARTVVAAREQLATLAAHVPRAPA
ncbi:MAG: competence/damage-inducible protein A [Acidobacteria bacterium]|nr:MAG: competence/damage-inducible protein A [Acidobacteriota bacterium]